MEYYNTIINQFCLAKDLTHKIYHGCGRVKTKNLDSNRDFTHGKPLQKRSEDNTI